VGTVRNTGVRTRVYGVSGRSYLGGMLTNRTSETTRPKRPKPFHALLVALAALALALTPATAAASGTPLSWSAPVDLSEGGVSTYGTVVAVDPAGDAAAAWMLYTGSNYAVQVSTRPAAGTWAPAVTLSPLGVSASEPSIAIDAQGDTVVAWQQYVGKDLIEVSTHGAGATSWSGTTTVSNPLRESAEAQVAIDPQGEAVVAWVGQNAAGDEIVQASAEQGFGGEWGAPISLSAAGADAESASLGMDAAGEAIAVWKRPNATNHLIQESQRPAGGSWSAPVDISPAGQNALQPRLAVDAKGDAAVIWDHYTGVNVTQVTTRLAGGSWSVPHDLTPGGENTFDARIALDAQGDATALWAAEATNEYVLRASGETAGTGIWSAPVDLAPASLVQPEPSVAVDPAGDAAVIWQTGEGGTSTAVEAATRKGTGGAWSAPVALSAPADEASQPQLAVEPTGAATAIWHNFHGAFTGVQSADFDPGTEAEAEAPGGGATGTETGPGPGTSAPSASAPSAAGAPAPSSSATTPPATARCPQGKALRKVKIRVPAEHAVGAKRKTRTVLRCVKAKPHREQPKHHRANGR
jgi:hypothetical protein